MYGEQWKIGVVVVVSVVTTVPSEVWVVICGCVDRLAASTSWPKGRKRGSGAFSGPGSAGAAAVDSAE